MPSRWVAHGGPPLFSLAARTANAFCFPQAGQAPVDCGVRIKEKRTRLSPPACKEPFVDPRDAQPTLFRDQKETMQLPLMQSGSNNPAVIAD